MHQRVSPFTARRHRRDRLAIAGLVAAHDWPCLPGVELPADSFATHHRAATRIPVVPPIAPLSPGLDRPRWSVMIPTFEPDENFERTLRSVLAQAWPAERMQIAVVDDGSRSCAIRDLVKAVDRTGRVEIRLHRNRLGISGNWNRAIALARGELVHLLHQDDFILPGFYERIDQGFRASPTAGMAFSRTRIVDGADRVIKTSSRQQWTTGILGRWLPRIAERQRVQTPAAVVPRSTYERLGGFRADLRQALDWEMWVRIAAESPVWYDPHVLAVHRRHDRSESNRLLSSGAIWPDLIHAISINGERFPEAGRQRVLEASARWYAGSAIRTVEKQLGRGDFAAAATTLEHLPRLLEFLPRAGDRSLPLRRAGVLQERLRVVLRRAA